MPKEQTSIRTFVKDSRRPDAKYMKIKRNADHYKFKLRLGSYLHTIVVNEKKKAQKMVESFVVPNLKVIYLNKKQKPTKSKKGKKSAKKSSQ